MKHSFSERLGKSNERLPCSQAPPEIYPNDYGWDAALVHPSRTSPFFVSLLIFLGDNATECIDVYRLLTYFDNEIE